MTHLLMIYDMPEPTNIDSREKILKFCEKNGIGFKAKATSEVNAEDIRCCDLVWSVRIQSKLGAYIIEQAKRNRCIIIAMYDDDFLAIKDYMVRRYFSYKAIIRILQLADYVMSCNDALGEKMLHISNNAKYIRTDTTVSLNEIHAPTIESPDIWKVVYYVNDGTTEVFESILNPVIENMSSEFIERLELNLIGVKPRVSRADEMYHVNYIEKCSLEEFRTILRNGNFTFGIAPLDVSEFSRAKYINKFFEFSRAGIPCIYSNVEPYNLKIIDGFDGVLAENNIRGWLLAIDRMRDTELRRTCVINAQNELKEIYTEDAFDKKMLEGIKEFSGYESMHTNCRVEFWMAKVKWRMICVIDPLAKAYGHYKIEGFRSVILWTWMHYILKRK